MLHTRMPRSEFLLSFGDEILTQTHVKRLKWKFVLTQNDSVACMSRNLRTNHVRATRKQLTSLTKWRKRRRANKKIPKQVFHWYYQQVNLCGCRAWVASREQGKRAGASLTVSSLVECIAVEFKRNPFGCNYSTHPMYSPSTTSAISNYSSIKSITFYLVTTGVSHNK